MSEWLRGYDDGEESCEKYHKHDTRDGFILGVAISVLAVIMLVYVPLRTTGLLDPFNPTTDCQEVWDMYPYVSEILDASHAVWAKLGLTDLKVHEFEYCVNHMPGGAVNE